MSTAKIIQADALPKGTQIKLLLVLEGGQKIVFKQKRCNVEWFYVIPCFDFVTLQPDRVYCNDDQPLSVQDCRKSDGDA